ncbi:hypothetical protein MalM25_33180 [Planctomycetes bacterium MalM25]|nr:hypothetical protein MalM25_33180 [Planctomycetes bacterium MalM25]
MLGARLWEGSGASWANGRVSVFRDQHDVPHVASGAGDRLEYLPVESERFLFWSARNYAVRPPATGIPKADQFRRAAERGFRVTLTHRTRVVDDAVLVAVGNREDEHVRIDKGCWDLQPGSFPCFCAPDSREQLPVPTGGGDLWELLEPLFGCLEQGPKLLAAAMLTGAFDPRVETPWLLLVGDRESGREGIRHAVKSLIDPVSGTIDHPADSGELDDELGRQRVAELGKVSAWPRPLLDRLLGSPLAALPAGDASERPWLVLDGIAEPVYPRPLLQRCIPIEATGSCHLPATPEFVQRWPQLLGALFDTLALAIPRRRVVGSAWFPRELASFVAHGHAVAHVLGFEASCFDEALSEQLARRDRLVQTAPVGPPW